MAVRIVLIELNALWACFGKLTQSSQEAVSGEVVLQERDPDLVENLLRFIYAKGEP
jgi:uncharacterized protein YuzB (UPF0349 family)